MLKRSHLAPICLVAAALFSAPACAHGYYGSDRAPRYDVGRRAYDNGYREGLQHGERDRRDGRRFDYRRQSDYRHADEGYNRGWGDRDDYQRAYRQGFAAGYTEGYNGARGPYAPAAQYPPPPPAGDYGRAERRSAAADVGFRDGYDAGRDDAHDRDRHDPISAKRYRSGDHGYRREFGPLDEYKREYRAAFLQGYDRGYREGRR